MFQFPSSPFFAQDPWGPKLEKMLINHPWTTSQSFINVRPFSIWNYLSTGPAVLRSTPRTQGTYNNVIARVWKVPKITAVDVLRCQWETYLKRITMTAFIVAQIFWFDRVHDIRHMTWRNKLAAALVEYAWVRVWEIKRETKLGIRRQ